MRVVLASFGTQGDVGPFVKLAQVLEARGHTTFSVTDAAHAARLTEAGLPGATPFARYDPERLQTDPRYANPFTGVVHVYRDVFMPLVADMHAAVTSALETPTDVVLVHPWCFGAHYAATAAGVPAGTMCLSPITWWSAADPGLYAPLRLPIWLRRWLMRGPVRWLIDAQLSRPLARERAALGLPAQASPFFALYRDGVNYGLWPPRLRGPAADDPHEAAIVGFDRPSHAEAPLPAPLQAFLDAGPPPLVLGLGSLLPPLAGDVFAAVRAAARRCGLRAVLVAAPPEFADEATFVVPRAPYPRLFEAAAVVVHHGGVNTTCEALRAGRPQLIVPFGTDQFDNAERVARLAGARFVYRTRATPARLADALRAIQGDPEVGVRAQAVAAALRAETDGTQRIAEDLERRFSKN